MYKKIAVVVSVLVCNSYAYAYVENPCKDGYQENNPTNHYFITRFDTNCDKQVTQDEFTASATERFKHMDINGDKFISLDEFLTRYADDQVKTNAAAKAKPEVKSPKSPDPEKVFTKLDVNGDKKVAEAEYYESRNKWFTEQDKNKDGKISREDAQ